jgi:hypothetical protein
MVMIGLVRIMGQRFLAPNAPLSNDTVARLAVNNNRPLPVFFVNADSKGFKVPLSLLESMSTGVLVGVDSEGLTVGQRWVTRCVRKGCL